jgi:hypothetical protein
MFHLRSSVAKLEMSLRRDELLTVDVAEPLVVTCVSGSLWLTAPDTGDIVVSSRQAVVVHGRGRVVIQAFEPTRVELSTRQQPIAA